MEETEKMQWELRERGFLPTPDPLESLEDGSLAVVEALGVRLPELVASRRFRETAVEILRGFAVPESLVGDGPEVERLFLLFCYFASAYIHLPGLAPTSRLPAEIAVPLVRLAEQCGRPPILSYASYCLLNWRRINARGPIALGNLQLLQNFSLEGDGKEDEDWFILVHVDIEARAGAGLRALVQAGQGVRAGDSAAVESSLEGLAASLAEMNRTMDRMPEHCRPEVYFRKVRPYIFGFTGVIYEGCFQDAAQTFRGETGAQSSIIPTLLLGLGIRHKSSLLTAHLEDMRNYMPPAHRDFVQAQVSVRDHIVAAARQGDAQGRRLRELYNTCLTEILAFRSRHFDYAVNYIERRCDNPLATGGTPYVPWLRQLLEETKTYFLD
jgi:indoleamine 2,3-dioxygenase